MGPGFDVVVNVGNINNESINVDSPRNRHISNRSSRHRPYRPIEDIDTIEETEDECEGVDSIDPNQKLGVAGYGDRNFVAAGSRLGYRVDFENLDTATAPAKVVTIFDPLGENLNLSTFELTEIGFGDLIIAVPPGRQYFETVVDYAYSDDEYEFEIEVHVEAWLEDATLFVNFISIDPDTGMPPADALFGFLPPENETGRGQGFVSYLIRHNEGLPSGTLGALAAGHDRNFGREFGDTMIITAAVVEVKRGAGGQVMDNLQQSGTCQLTF